ncbi:hypothetical protein BaRGS_00008372 [Batillaria attramentaria]|uniref:Uncharacterized protein n=1 Tax=Batillaria attramentaria TaxID=370345 RepID=A0ABD0LLT7_9CAEN
MTCHASDSETKLFLVGPSLRGHGRTSFSPSLAASNDAEVRRGSNRTRPQHSRTRGQTVLFKVLPMGMPLFCHAQQVLSNPWCRGIVTTPQHVSLAHTMKNWLSR